MPGFRRAHLALASALVFTAPALAAGSDHAPIQLGPDFVVTPLADGVWMHTTWRRFGGNGVRYPSNGLLVRDGSELILIDTAWGIQPTIDLLAWVNRTFHEPVTRAIITHAHDDRLGGGPVLVERGIPFTGHPLTARLAPKFHLPPPAVLAGLDAPGSVATVGSLEVFHPGAGHTRDNITVWIPSAHILFGGCMVKAADATDLGNIADADVPAWPASIQRLRDRYGRKAALIVPGHGDPGGPELLQHTADLLAQSSRP
jgi:metallo-beta-lactamase class B